MLKGKTIIITGGSSGIGKVLAERFANQGASLALIARDMEKLRSVQADITGNTGQEQKVEVFSCDVSKEDDVNKTMEAIAGKFGLPDILINSAGIVWEGNFERQSVETFREIMDINFFGVLHCIKAAVPLFKQKGEGWIVNICSLGGLMGIYGYSGYCSSKHALKGLTESIRGEFKLDNIKVQIVYPPEFDSPMVDKLNEYRSYENKKLVHTIPVLGVNAVADSIMKGMEKGTYEIIPGRMTKLTALASRLLPTLSGAYTDSRLKKFYEKKSTK